MPPTPPPRSSSLAQAKANGHKSTNVQDQNGDQRDIHVLVTGYGQFGTIITNPSFLICSALPAELVLPSEPSPSHTAQAPVQPPRRIILHRHPTELPVDYQPILDLHSNLINPRPGTIPGLPSSGYDWILHIGVAGPAPQYQLESLARAREYHQIGKTPAEGVTDRFTKQGAPETVYTGWNDEDVLKRWNGAFVRVGEETKEDKPNLKISTNAGLFLCEFILYCSLASRYLDAKEGKPGAKEKEGKVAFLHVADLIDEASIFKGAEIAKAAITSLVNSWEQGHRRTSTSAE